MEAAARVCLPEPSLSSPGAPCSRRLDAREAGGWLLPGASGSRPRAARAGPGLGPAVPSAPHPPPSPSPFAQSSPSPGRAGPCGVSGSGGWVG